MPHLSPMSWVMSIIMFWLSVSILFSTLWWTKNYSFETQVLDNKPKNKTLWKWL